MDKEWLDFVQFCTKLFVWKIWTWTLTLTFQSGFESSAELWDMQGFVEIWIETEWKNNKDGKNVIMPLQAYAYIFKNVLKKKKYYRNTLSTEFLMMDENDSFMFF